MKSLTMLFGPAALAVVVAANSVVSRRGTEVRDALYGNARIARLDGAAQKAGNGTTRAYVLVDKESGKALEVGVALSEGVMDGLPAPRKLSMADMASMEHMDMHTWVLDLPKNNPSPYKFVTFGWNPQGHEPAGVWDVPHFDFHFYTVGRDVRASIVLSNPDFASKAAKYPAEVARAPFYLDAATAAKTEAKNITVPEMGLHWFDVRTPEIQALAGHPEAYKPFTKTFIYGSWDGQFIFSEPMITRAYLLSVREQNGDNVAEVPVVKFSEPGSYGSAYRIKWDAENREYRIALTQF
ncbi:MAG TPA: hypothetical protein VJ867_14005 [Gemmatimonadaceae bacterium]|nr:hypothetical protein [Gemmatimonadaceae bacterium]